LPAAQRLIDRTGSVIEPNGIDLYARLLRNTRHSAAALGMMASWDLDPLLRNLPGLANNLLLVVGDNDRMVPPEQAERVREMLPAARIRRLPDCGHLLHEERPRETAALIMSLREGAGGSEPA